MNKKVFVYASVVPAVVFLFFLPALFNGFTNWDVPSVLLDNPLIKDFSWHGIQTILVTMWTGQFERFIPFSMIFYTAEYHFFGTNPLGYHGVSVLLHCLDVGAVFILIYLLTERAGAALMAALLFGLHPLHVEPVALATAQTYLIGTFFFLSAVILYVWSSRVPVQKFRFEILVVISFSLALLFYSGLTMSLPFVLLAVDYYLQGRIDRDQVLRKIPFFLMSFYFGWLTFKAAHHVTADFVPTFLTQHFSLFHRINLSCEALWIYAQKFFIPHPLSCLYPTTYYTQQAFLLFTVMGGAVFLFFTAFRQKPGGRICFLGLWWFLLTILPFLHIHGVSESIIYDRYLYLPSVGFLLILVGMWESFPLKKWVGSLGLFWFIFIIFLSSQQIGVWRDSGTLWTNFISQYPGFADGYLNRSDYYLTIHQPRLALKDIDVLLKIDPQNAGAYQNKGHAFFQLRQWHLEVEALTQVIELKPDFVHIYVDRGVAFYMLGEDKRALEDFNRALQKDPNEVKALIDRQIVLQELRTQRF